MNAIDRRAFVRDLLARCPEALVITPTSVRSANSGFSVMGKTAAGLP